MGKVFISYRHSDERGAIEADRLAEALGRSFGRDNVFYDLESLEAGANWRDHAAARLKECHIILAVIGPGWGDLNAPEDPIRFELETAQKLGLKIQPVLVKGASMPEADALPVSLSDLRDVIASPIGSRGEAYRREVEGIVEVVTKAGDVSGSAAKPSARRLHPAVRSALGVLVVMALSALVYVVSFKVTEDTLPARYTVIKDNIWLNSEPKGCKEPFDAAQKKARSALGPSEDLRGRFDEPACRNYCTMFKGSKVELHADVKGGFAIVRVLKPGPHPKKAIEEASQGAHQWSEQRDKLVKWKQCEPSDEGYATRLSKVKKGAPWTAVFERDWWPWPDLSEEDARALEPKQCVDARVAVEFHGKPNLRALCDAPELWGLEKERAKAYKNRALVLSNEPEALKGFEKRSAAWLEERKACGTDVTCIGERIEARIQEIARQGRAGVRESH
jgi:hypothetical protein